MRDSRLVAVAFAAMMLVVASCVPALGVGRTVLGECFLASG